MQGGQAAYRTRPPPPHGRGGQSVLRYLHRKVQRATTGWTSGSGPAFQRARMPSQHARCWGGREGVRLRILTRHIALTLCAHRSTTHSVANRTCGRFCHGQNAAPVLSSTDWALGRFCLEQNQPGPQAVSIRLPPSRYPRLRCLHHKRKIYYK